MKLTPRGEVEVPSVHLAPLIDVIFLVLVAYIEATVLMTVQIGLPIDLPTAETSQPETATPALRLAITREGGLFLDQEPLPLDALRATLVARRTAEPRLRVHIHADRSTAVYPVVQVLDIARQAGVLGVTLATEEIAGPSSPAIEPVDRRDAELSDPLP